MSYDEHSDKQDADGQESLCHCCDAVYVCLIGVTGSCLQYISSSMAYMQVPPDDCAVPRLRCS